MLLIMWDAFRNRYPVRKFAMLLILYIAGVTIVQAPFMIRNYMKAGRPGSPLPIRIESLYMQQPGIWVSRAFCYNSAD